MNTKAIRKSFYASHRLDQHCWIYINIWYCETNYLVGFILAILILNSMNCLAVIISDNIFFFWDELIDELFGENLIHIFTNHNHFVRSKPTKIIILVPLFYFMHSDYYYQKLIPIWTLLRLLQLLSFPFFSLVPLMISELTICKHIVSPIHKIDWTENISKWRRKWKDKSKWKREKRDENEWKK